MQAAEMILVAQGVWISENPIYERYRFFVIKIKLVDSLQFFGVELLVQLSLVPLIVETRKVVASPLVKHYLPR